MMQKMPWEMTPDELAAAGGGAPRTSGGGIVTLPPTQEELQAASLRARDQYLQEEAAGRDRIRFNERNAPKPAEPPSGYRFIANGGLQAIPGGPADKRVVGAGGKPLRQGDGDKLSADVDTYAALKNAIRGFRDDFAGNVVGGRVENAAERTLGIGTEGQGDWWANFYATDNLIRNNLFGASLTAGEKSAYADTTVAPNMRPDKIRENLTRRQEIVRKALTRKVDRFKAAGYNPAEIDAATGEYGAEFTRGASLATGSTKTERDPAREKALDALIRSGADLSTINATSRAMGGVDIAGTELAAARAYLRANPGYKGGFADSSTEVPTTFGNRLAASPTGTGILAAADMGVAGLSDEITAALGGGVLEDLNARKQAAFALNPKAAFAGQIVGTGLGMTGMNAIGRGTGIASRFAAPQLAADIAFGAASGAGQTNDNRLLGSTVGALGGVAGHFAGQGIAAGAGRLARTRPGLATVNAAIDTAERGRGFAAQLPGVGGLVPTAPLSPIARAAAPSPAQNAALGELRTAGIDNVRSSLNEAQTLGVPLSLADTAAQPRELAAAATRRSPTAAQFVEEQLLSRSRGQYDRLGAAVERDLGPTANIPQQSADLMRQAQTAAAERYPEAYAADVISTPELGAVLDTPFGRSALGRARTIAANERRDPMGMGFAQDANGDVLLNPAPLNARSLRDTARGELDAAQEVYRSARATPGKPSMEIAWARVQAARAKLRAADDALGRSPIEGQTAAVPGYTTQTLDYVKRGMDDVLEGQRNPITGRLVLDEAGRAQNQVRGQLLSEVDRLNPAYREARDVYAGPMQSRDALSRGQDAYTLHPDELGIQVGNQTPEHLAQMQLGYRSTFMDHAGKVRDNSNPWEATLGSPVARQRLGAMYPDWEGMTRLLRTRDLEGQAQQTTNAILGNSKTPQRQIADRAFDGGGALPLLVDGATMAAGGVPLATVAARFGPQWAKDSLKLGLGRRAAAKADELAPMLTTAEPGAGLATLDDLLARDSAYQAFVTATTPRRRRGFFGAPMGSAAGINSVQQEP
jgi:hypothetical protein